MTQDWDDTDEWDDDDYDQFVQREFPDFDARTSGLPAIWKWTAWTLLLLIALIWVVTFI